ncbi:MAG TPA: KGG domain-containing protein [Thermoanaerobaculia bacterium]
MADSKQGSHGSSQRGFAAMDENRQRAIASEGGRAAHQKGTAHEFTSQEAREAGRKGGEAVSRDRAHMSAIGRMGGESSRGPRKAASGSSRGGTHEQHVEAGRQSHKNL